MPEQVVSALNVLFDALDAEQKLKEGNYDADSLGGEYGKDESNRDQPQEQDSDRNNDDGYNNQSQNGADLQPPVEGLPSDPNGTKQSYQNGGYNRGYRGRGFYNKNVGFNNNNRGNFRNGGYNNRGGYNNNRGYYQNNNGRFNNNGNYSFNNNGGGNYNNQDYQQNNNGGDYYKKRNYQTYNNNNGRYNQAGDNGQVARIDQQSYNNNSRPMYNQYDNNKRRREDSSFNAPMSNDVPVVDSQSAVVAQPESTMRGVQAYLQKDTAQTEQKQVNQRGGYKKPYTNNFNQQGGGQQYQKSYNNQWGNDRNYNQPKKYENNQQSYQRPNRVDYDEQNSGNMSYNRDYQQSNGYNNSERYERNDTYNQSRYNQQRDSRSGSYQYEDAPLPPLPSGWEQYFCEKERKYYYHNQQLNKTQWERP